MTDWFVSRLPELASGQDEEQGKQWREAQAEMEALTAWLPLVPEKDAIWVERAGSRFAMQSGPFHAWAAFCEQTLTRPLGVAERSNVLWTLGQVARQSGDLDRAASAAREQREVDQGRGAERDAALAAGLLSDVLSARGDLEEALRIRREEQLPVYERLGDVRSLLIGRMNLALTFLKRNQPGDRETAAELLHLALQAAEAMRIPEAEKIRSMLQRKDLAHGEASPT